MARGMNQQQTTRMIIPERTLNYSNYFSRLATVHREIEKECGKVQGF